MHQAAEIARVAATPHHGGMVHMLLRSIILLVIIGTAGCSDKGRNHDVGSATGADNNKSNSARMLRRGLPGEPRTLDPQLADDTYSFPVLRDLYEGLTAEDSMGQIVPGAAQSWTVDETGTVYTFVIRPSAKWSDGDAIVAEEFVQGLRRAVDPHIASGSAALLAAIR